MGNCWLVLLPPATEGPRTCRWANTTSVARAPPQRCFSLNCGLRCCVRGPAVAAVETQVKSTAGVCVCVCVGQSAVFARSVTSPDK